MTMTAPPTIPLITDPSTFAQRAQDWVVWQAEQLYPELAALPEVLAAETTSTSTTSLAIGTGAKSLTVETGKIYVAGMSVKLGYTTDGTKYMLGEVTSYNSTTGALEVTVSVVQGSGTFATWQVSLAFNLDINSFARIASENTWTAQQVPMSGSATATTTADWDCDTTGQVYDLAVGTSNFALNAPTNVLDKACYILRVTQHGTTARTITWNASYKFAGGIDPVLSTTLGAVDIFTFIGGAGGVMHCVGQAKGLA